MTTYGNCPIELKKGGRTYIGTVVHGFKSMLQGDHSTVKLEIPEGLYGTIKGCIHTNIAPFMSHNIIPDSECLVAPIPEYTFIQSPEYQSEVAEPFKITLLTPEQIAKDKTEYLRIRVRHGDIHTTPVKVRLMPENPTGTDSYSFRSYDRTIEISTRSFSQFICTVCKKYCSAGARVFIFGGITQISAKIYTRIRVYLCSFLYDLEDFKMVRLMTLGGGIFYILVF